MACVDVVMENSGPSLSGEFDVTGNRDDGFGESVDNHEKGIVPIRFW